MKKILFLLLCVATSYAQIVPTGQETAFDYGIQNTASQLDDNATYITVQTSDGVQGKSTSSVWAKKIYVDNADATKSFLSTGLIKNGLVTTNADPTKFNITAGIGIITNFDNPETPTSTIVSFPAFTGITPTYLTTGNITYVAINSSAAVVMQATPFTNIQRRDLIALGAVIHSNLTTINLVNNISAPTNSGTNQLHDLMEAIGALNISGNKYAGNGNLTINKSAGVIFKLGVNFANNWKDPNNLYLTPQTSLTFRYRTQNGTEGLDVTSIDPSVYDLNNVLTSVPVNRFSIQTVTLFQTGQTRIQYGQSTYATMAEAEAAIITRAYVVESNIAANGITRAYIILRHNATDLTNATTSKIIEAQKFGGVASGGVALTDSAIIAALGFTPENVANKNISNGYVGLESNGKFLTSQINNTDGNLGQLISENLAETTTFTDNFYVNTSTGTLVGSENFRTTGYMPVVGGYKYLYNRKDSGLINTILGAWYDKNNVYISGILLDLNKYGLFTAPSNAAYARVSYSMGTGVNNDYFYRSYKFSSYGDSITAQNTWQPLLSQYFSLFPINVGTGGAPLSGSGTGSLNNDTKLAGIPSDSDIITILAGTNDWAQSVALGTENSIDVTTFYGALNVTFKKLKLNHPNATIISLGTTYGEYPSYFTNPIGILNNLNLSTSDYANAVVIAAKNHNIRFVRTDNLWNNKNIANFITFDGAYLHPNAEGGRLMASKISLDIVQDILKLKAKENKAAITTALTGTSNILPKYDGLGNLVSSSVTDATNTVTSTKDLLVRDITIGRGAGGGSTNLAFGNFALGSNSTGGNQVAIGSSSLFSSTNTSFDVGVGALSLATKTTGNGNVAIGYRAGRYIADGVTNLTNSLESIFIGYHSYPLGDSQSNQIVIGRGGRGLGSNTSVLGNSSTVQTWIGGRLTLGTTTDNGVDQLQVNGTISATSYTGSATLTGTPTAPTAPVGTNTTQIATTAFVNGEIAANGYWTKTGNDIANNNTGMVNIGTFSTPYTYKLKVEGGVVSNNNIYAESYWIDNGTGMFRGANTYELSFKGDGTNWFTFTRPEAFANTSGTLSILRINPSFYPTSGTAIVNFSNINPIINQTGGANGVTRGLYINPTLTSAFDFRAIEVTAGKVIVPVTTETAIQEYADNSAAIIAGLSVGTHYRTGDLLKIVH